MARTKKPALHVILIDNHKNTEKTWQKKKERQMKSYKDSAAGWNSLKSFLFWNFNNLTICQHFHTYRYSILQIILYNRIVIKRIYAN